MATNSSFQLFSSEKSASTPGFTLGFLDFPEPALPPPPPSVEVLSSEVSSSLNFDVEKVSLGESTLLKGRVSTKDVFGLPNSDLVPGVYEGGLKLWEGSLDLVKALRSEVQDRNLSLTGKRVLELGCGHGLPGIFACLEGASIIHFQDFNAEVLRCLTIPNVTSNLSGEVQSVGTGETNCITGAEIRYFAGDWSEIHQLLPLCRDNENNLKSSPECSSDVGYDIILMAETIYSISAQQSQYELIKKCLSHPHGAVYMSAKKHYFGVGGGTRQFLSMIEKDGIMKSSLVSEVTDGSSNVRELLVLLPVLGLLNGILLKTYLKWTNLNKNHLKRSLKKNLIRVKVFKV